MRRAAFFLFASLGLGIEAPEVIAQTKFYAIDQNERLWSFTRGQTSEATAIGRFGTEYNWAWGDLSFDSKGDLYAYVTSVPATDSPITRLFRLNPNNAAATLIGSYSGRYFEGFTIIGETGYASGDPRFQELYSVDLSTGNATLVGSFGSYLNLNMSGLASNGTTLYGVRGDVNDLVTLSPQTAAMNIIGVHGIPSLTNLAYSEDSLWGVTAALGTDTWTLYSIDPQTAQRVIDSSVPAPAASITGLTAAPIPEPAAVGILLFGVAWRMRRLPRSRR